MNIIELKEAVFNNFEAFYQMVISSTLVSSYNSDFADVDSRKVMRFVSESFGVEKELDEEFENHILSEMMNIGLIADYHALSSEDFLDEDDMENLEFYEIKGRALEEIKTAEISVGDYSSNVRANMKYDCFHHVYNSQMRFFDIKKLAEKGKVLFTRQAGLLYALGIGCEKDFEIAERLLKRCIWWGDRVSALYLNHLYLKFVPEKYENGLFRKIYEITDGVLNCFDNVVRCEKIGKEWEYFNLINMVKQSVVLKRKETLINVSLADTLSSENLSFKAKAEFVASFEKFEPRKEATSKNVIGFIR